MGKIYFTSDLHFGHNKEFLYSSRGFNSIEKHNETVFNNINSLVTNEDDLYILGDLMLNDNEKGLELISKLNGKIHIILGNHDTDARQQLYKTLPNVVEICYATILKYKKAHFYLSHYPTITANPIDDSPWHKNLISLFGHTHQQNNFYYDNNPYMYHVGLDSHNCFPIEIEDIVNEIREYKIKNNVF